MPDSYIVRRLQSLIEENQIQQIHICRFHDLKLHQQSNVWRFGHEFIHIGDQPYNLNRVITFKVIDHLLYLYF